MVLLILSVNLCTCKWQDLFSDLDGVNKALIRNFLPVAQDALFSADIKPECSGALLKLLSATREGKAWALKCKFPSLNECLGRKDMVTLN